MAADYQLTANPDMVRRVEDNAYIPNDPANRDWIEYQNWLALGNTPDPYVPPPEPEPQPDALAEAQRANARLDEGVSAANDAWEANPVPETPELMETQQGLEARVTRLEEAVKAMCQAQNVSGSEPMKGA